MRPGIVPAALALAVLSSPVRAGEARVTFAAPERFTDASLSGDGPARADEPALRELADHIRLLARQDLPEEQVLEVQVTDVDLAGRFDPLRFESRRTRVTTSIDWPRIALRYRLLAGERVLREGEERLADPSFDRRPGVVRPGGRLFSEKAMLDDWFQARFPGRG